MTSSKIILQQLANGEEVAGFNASFFSRALREAFADGAAAIAFRDSVQSLLTPAETVPDHAPAEAIEPLAAPALRVDLPATPVAPAQLEAEHTTAAVALVSEAQPQPSADTTHLAPEPASLPPEVESVAPDAVAAPAAAVDTLQPSMPVEPAAEEESTEDQTPAEPAVSREEANTATAVVEQTPATEPAAQETVAVVVLAIVEDELPEPMAEQNDNADEQGWRPSEDAMLLDEYEGLGLELDEIAERHGRAVADIVLRLRGRHGLTVEGFADVAAPSDEPMQAELASAEVAEVEESREVAAPQVDVGTPEQAETPAVEQPVQAQVAPNYEEVIDEELRRATPDAVTFASGVLKNLQKMPAMAGKLVAYLGEAKAHQKLSDRLRLALIEKIKAHPPF